MCALLFIHPKSIIINIIVIQLVIPLQFYIFIEFLFIVVKK